MNWCTTSNLIEWISNIRKPILLYIILIYILWFVFHCITRSKNKDHFPKLFTQRSSLELIDLFFAISMIISVIVYPFIRIMRINGTIVLDLSLASIFILILVLLIHQKENSRKMYTEYQDLASYSRMNERLVKQYRINRHENKNQMVIIKSMAGNDSKELVRYINSILKNGENSKFEWINELEYLPLIGLKGFLNYKVIEMKELNINVSILVSKDVENSKLENLNINQKEDLYSIVGVYLDNAREACLLCGEKEISINIYKEGKNLYFEIANTYLGPLDLKRIDNYGYSTKGVGRGIGLHLVKDILSASNVFKTERFVNEEYYVQYLIIDLGKI